jgi:hypothetical protein
LENYIESLPNGAVELLRIIYEDKENNIKIHELALEEKAKKLKEYIKSLNNFEIVTKLDGNYNNMGAIIIDGILQAGMSYKTVVKPRIVEYLKKYPNVTTTSDFETLIQKIPISELIHWKKDSAKTKRIVNLVSFFKYKKIETQNDLNKWLLSADNINEFKVGKSYFYELKDKPNLLAIHKGINMVFQNSIPLNNSVVSFRKNKSYLDLFEPHRKNYYFLRLDIKSFFHSIEIDDIKHSFQSYFDDDYIDENKKQSLIDAFINIVTYKIPSSSDNEDFQGKQILPMGFVTSPVISNIVFRKIDIQIQKFCSQHNIVYTRYADDMLFSSDKNSSYVHSQGFIKEISILVAQMKFKLNQHKTLKATHTLSLNGYTIQYSNIIKDILGEKDEEIINEFRLSNKKISIIKKMIHLIETEDQTPQYILKKLFNYQLPANIPADKRKEYNRQQLTNKLTGHRSYLLSFVTYNKKYDCIQLKTIEKYILLVNKLNNCIENL